MYLIITSLIFYLAYLELSPGLGNIWYRLNSENIKVINFTIMINMLVQPIHNLSFWNFENWDLNFFIYYVIIKILFNIYNGYF